MDTKDLAEQKFNLVDAISIAEQEIENLHGKVLMVEGHIHNILIPTSNIGPTGPSGKTGPSSPNLVERIYIMIGLVQRMNDRIEEMNKLLFKIQ